MKPAIPTAITVLLFFALLGSSSGTTASVARGTGCAGANATVDSLSTAEYRRAVLCLINKRRDARSLKRNRALQKAAQRHTRVMENQNCLSHQCAGEAPLVQRVRRTGYSNSPIVGEIIFRTIPGTSPNAIVTVWMGSPEHKAQIQRPRYRHAGVGVVAERSAVWSTVVFGRK